MPGRSDVFLRVGGFLIAGFLLLVLAGANRLDTVTRSGLAAFAAGLGANLFIVSKFERSRFADFGLGWPPRYFVHGLLIGAGALLGPLAVAVLWGVAEFTPATPERPAATLAFWVTAGVFGEEMLFRGYAFQYLARVYRAPWIIAGSGLLFGAMHLANDNVQPLGAANTVLWGTLLGYACVRAGNLWLPCGIHLGWNLALTLCTSNLSGTTIRATAWDLRWSAGELWSGGNYGLEGGLLATMAALPVFLLLRRVR